MPASNPNATANVRRVHWPAVLLLAASAACSGIQTEATTDGAADFTAYRSFSWSHRAEPAGQPGQPVDDTDLEAAVRAAVDATLVARRLTRADRDEADLLLGLTLRVEERLQANDPYFATYPAEKFELGHLVIDAVDAKTGERVWRGRAQNRLRYTERLMGVSSAQFVATGEERRWRIEDMVEAVLVHFPIR
jgi:hypothetical protein